MVGAIPNQTMDRARICVEAEQDRLVGTKELGKTLIGDSLVVLGRALDLEQVDHVHEGRLHADLLEHIECRQRLERGHVAARSDNQIGLIKAGSTACPLPLGKALFKLGTGLVHRDERRRRLLATEDGVHAVRGRIRALGHGKRHICIARIVRVDHMGVVCLVEQQIHKTGILMRESVVVLTPHVAGQQNIQAGDGSTPGNLAHAGLKPLAVLVDHGVDDMHKRLVGGLHTP